MKTPKPKLLTNNGKSPLLKLGASASKKNKLAFASPLGSGAKKNYKKTQLPEQAFAIPGFGNTGMDGES
jgi:hypothetical protein